MGKALVFAGLNVQNPLPIVHFEEDDLDVIRIGECFAKITSTQSAALKTLIRSLKLAGTFDKLSYLILPAIAGTVDEAIRNVMVDSDSIPSTTDMSFTSHLLFVSNTTDVTSYIKPNTLGSTNLSMGVFVNCTDYPFPNGPLSEQILKVNTGYVFYRNSTQLGYEDGRSSNRYKTFLQSEGKMSMSTDIDNSSTIMVYDEDSVESVALDTSKSIKATDTASVKLSGVPYDPEGTARSYRAFTGGYKLLWISSLLTQTELVATHKAFDEFITSVESPSQSE